MTYHIRHRAFLHPAHIGSLVNQRECAFLAYASVCLSRELTRRECSMIRSKARDPHVSQCGLICCETSVRKDMDMVR